MRPARTHEPKGGNITGLRASWLGCPMRLLRVIRARGQAARVEKERQDAAAREEKEQQEAFAGAEKERLEAAAQAEKARKASEQELRELQAADKNHSLAALLGAVERAKAARVTGELLLQVEHLLQRARVRAVQHQRRDECLNRLTTMISSPRGDISGSGDALLDVEALQRTIDEALAYQVSAAQT